MNNDKSNRKSAETPRDPSRRSAMGAGLAAAIALITAMASSPASAKSAVIKKKTKRSIRKGYSQEDSLGRDDLRRKNSGRGAKKGHSGEKIGIPSGTINILPFPR